MKKTIYLLIIEALIFLGILFTCNNQYKHDLNTGLLNYIAAVDSLHKELLKKDKDILYWKLSCVTVNNNLLIYKKERKEIERKLNSKIAYLSNIKSEIKYDTIKIPIEIVKKDSNIISKFNYNDKWLLLNGTTFITPHTSQINIYNINIPLPITVGLSDNYLIFVKTKNPYIHITDIQGAVIDKSKLYQKEKRFSFSVQGGVGCQYGIINRQIDFGPYIGLGVSYKLF